MFSGRYRPVLFDNLNFSLAVLLFIAFFLSIQKLNATYKKTPNMKSDQCGSAGYFPFFLQLTSFYWPDVD